MNMYISIVMDMLPTPIYSHPFTHCELPCQEAGLLTTELGDMQFQQHEGKKVFLFFHIRRN